MALEMIATARTVEELRQAQAVVLPVHCGLSLEQIAQRLGARWPGPAGCTTGSWPGRRWETVSGNAVDVFTGATDSLILPHVNTTCVQIFVDESRRHPDRRIVIVLDGAGWHRSGALTAPPNMRLL